MPRTAPGLPPSDVLPLHRAPPRMVRSTATAPCNVGGRPRALVEAHRIRPPRFLNGDGPFSGLSSANCAVRCGSERRAAFGDSSARPGRGCRPGRPPTVGVRIGRPVHEANAGPGHVGDEGRSPAAASGDSVGARGGARPGAFELSGAPLDGGRWCPTCINRAVSTARAARVAAAPARDGRRSGREPYRSAWSMTVDHSIVLGARKTRKLPTGAEAAFFGSPALPLRGDFRSLRRG